MNKAIVAYSIIGILILGILVMTFFPGIIYAFRDSGKVVDDKCSPASGYTEETWREHMSHHPNIYKDCL